MLSLPTSQTPVRRSFLLGLAGMGLILSCGGPLAPAAGMGAEIAAGPGAQRVVVASVEQPERSAAGLRTAGFLRPLKSGPGPGSRQAYRATLRLPPGLVQYFRPGDRVEALLPTQGRRSRLAGRVVAVTREHVIAGVRFEARIIDHLLLEFLVYPGRPVPRFRVPLSAIINPTGNQAYLMRVVSRTDRDFLAERVPVTVVDRAPRDGRIGVIGELTRNERVVVRGHANLLHGERVEPIAEAAL